MMIVLQGGDFRGIKITKQLRKQIKFALKRKDVILTPFK